MEQYFYTIKINGVMQPVRVPNEVALQSYINNQIPVDQQHLVEVVKVDQFGRELLLG